MSQPLSHRVFYKSSETMEELEDRSVDLIITSPPYNVGKEYESFRSVDEWKDLIAAVAKECYRVAKDDCRICWNVFGIGTLTGINECNPVLFNSVKILEAVGFKPRSLIVWNQKDNLAGRITRGSMFSASSPAIVCSTEYILVMFKNRWKKDRTQDFKLSKERFFTLTNDVWEFASEHNREHPAPFPLELPLRCIDLFSFPYEHILDPFLGSGTTIVACKMRHRSCTGYEINEKYRPIIEKRTRDVRVFNGVVF